MDLHEQLRELVAHQGPSVAESAEGFRAALDDYLGEDEATTGQLNLLVDAVRLGAAIAPKELEFRADLPKTRSGKIMRRLLRARELGLPEGDISALETDA